MEFVKVVKPGLFTTVQDLGRHSYQVYGVSACGGMDPISLRLANILVGNDEGEAVLEVTLIGPRLRFEEEGIIAITGGDISPSINGKSISMWKSLYVKKGDELSFGTCKYGCRAYIAFAGGIQVPKIMDSRSTFIRGNYGGVEGRALKTGDLIPIGLSRFTLGGLVGRRLRPQDIPDYKTIRSVQFVWGPQDSAFTEEARKTFVSKPYTVSNNSDRMGYRLEGESLKHIDGADIISDFITVGSIQVPANGQPIILMADCQMSGGYTKVGVVIGVDIPYLAQKKPGDSVSFQAIEVEAAQELWRKQEQLLSELRLNNSLIPSKAQTISS
jgi:antagonist of KipI